MKWRLDSHVGRKILKTTGEFMSRMPDPEHRLILMANQCELEIFNNTTFTFYLVDGKVPLRDAKAGQ